jgi:hypothetical protein
MGYACTGGEGDRHEAHERHRTAPTDRKLLSNPKQKVKRGRGDTACPPFANTLFFVTVGQDTFEDSGVNKVV